MIISRCSDCLKILLLAGLTLSLLVGSPVRAVTIKPQPDPGLGASIRASDLIAEVDILAGGPFSAVARIRTVYKGTAPRIIELEGYNSLNGDTVHSGLPTGGRYILFLSKTGRSETFSTLTSTAPRLRIDDGEILLALGNPPFRVPIKHPDMIQALQLILAAHLERRPPERAIKVIRDWWDRNQIESRYLAIAVAGLVGETRALPLIVEASGMSLLRLRLTAIEALKTMPHPESLAALRELAKDARASVSRTAAAALIELQDLDSVDVLLDWARKASTRQMKYAEGDKRRAKIQGVINLFRAWLELKGPLMKSSRVVPGLLDLAQGPDATMARDALYLLGLLATQEEIPRLLDMADDPVFKHVEDAKIALFRATLREAKDLEDFRAWWQEAKDGFGERFKRKAVEAAAQGLAGSTDVDEQAHLKAIVLGAPGGISLVSTAPLLMSTEGGSLFETYDLLQWNTPLALPFLLERLGQRNSRTRRAALYGLSLLAHRYPRLRNRIHPYIRAALSDEDGGVRRTAAATAAVFEDVKVLPVLFDSLRYSGSYEASDSAKAIYMLTARTLGYGDNEPAPDLEAAARRLQGWWNGLGVAATTWKPPLSRTPKVSVTKSFPMKQLEATCKIAESRKATAALAVLLEEKKPADPFWEELFKSSRIRDRAHGLIGMSNLEDQDGTTVARLANLFEGDARAAALLRAEAIVAMASIRGGHGPRWLAKWLSEGQGAEADVSWRRLAIMSLALADGEPQSLSFLANCLVSPDKEEDVEDVDDVDRTDTLQQAALTALCARKDGTPALIKALDSSTAEIREMALRELAARKHVPAVPGMLRVLSKAGALSLGDLVRTTAPLLRQQDVIQLEKMLISADDAARISAAWLLSLRWNLAKGRDTQSALLVASRDFTDEVRMRTAEVIGKLRLKEALPTLVSMLRAVDSGVKAAAAEAVAAIGDPDACAVAAEEAKTLYRLDARWVRALGIHGGDAELKMIMGFSKSNRWIDQRVGIDGLGVCKRPEALARLMELHRDNEASFQTHASLALALQGDDAVAELEKDLARADTNRNGCARAMHALSRIHTLRAARCLARLISHQELGDLADFCLRRLSGGLEAGFDPKSSKVERERVAKKWLSLITRSVLQAAKEAAGH